MKMSASGNREKAQDLIRMAGIKQAPVDLNKIAKLLELMIIPYPFPDKRKGMIFIEAGVRAIGVNEKHPLALQRYTVGHEFGHFVNGHQHEDNLFIEDESKYYSHHFQNEREADAFSAELLMPIEFLKKDLSEIGIDLDELTELYQVSKTALNIRLNNLRFYEKYQPNK